MSKPVVLVTGALIGIGRATGDRFWRLLKSARVAREYLPIFGRRFLHAERVVSMKALAT